MTRTLSRRAACSLAVCLAVFPGGWGAPLRAGGAEICDDFEDGEVFDGDPMCWATVPGFPTLVDVADGDLRIRNNQAGAYGLLRTCESFTGDVAIRASVRVEEDPQAKGEIDLSLCSDGSCSGYIAELRSSGDLMLGRFDACARHEFGWVAISGFAPGDDHNFELSLRGERLEARVWGADAARPAEPTLSATDLSYSTGYAVVGTYSPDIGSAFRAVYHAVCTSKFDCNENGLPDDDDIAGGRSQDCNANGVPDECDLAAARSQDCNRNDVPDECDIARGTSDDSNANGVPDECDVPDSGLEVCDDFEDGDVFDEDPWCWATAPGFPTLVEVSGGDLRIRNKQANAYGLLRTCESFTGDVAIRASVRVEEDPQATGDIDLFLCSDGSCSGYAAELRSWGELMLGRFDACVLHELDSVRIPGFAPGDDHNFELRLRGDRLEARVWGAGASRPEEATVGVTDLTYRTGYAVVGTYSPNFGGAFRAVFHHVCIGLPDCNENGVPDDDDISAGTSQDCNANGVPDECDLAQGTSHDCNANDAPDECEIAEGTSADCNANGVPDQCDLASGRSHDCDENGVIDDCDVSPYPARLAGNTTGFDDSTFLGPPDRVCEGLGKESVTYDFAPAAIADGPGVDFSVYEGRIPVEFDLMDVLVSADGRDFTSVKGTEAPLVRVPGDEAFLAVLARSYDLEGSGVQAARYVRIQGTSAEPAGGGRGIELGAVGAIHLRVCTVEGPDFRRGDANDDGAADISDAVSILNWLFLGGGAPGCLASADTNGDGGTDLSDAVYLLGHLFLGGPQPAAPFPECGQGSLPTDETLGDGTAGCATPPKSCPQP